MVIKTGGSEIPGHTLYLCSIASLMLHGTDSGSSCHNGIKRISKFYNHVAIDKFSFETKNILRFSTMILFISDHCARCTIVQTKSKALQA